MRFPAYAFLGLTVCLTAHAQLVAEWDAAAETAVVFNSNYPGSAELANHYAKARGIRKERIIGLPCSQENAISRSEFEEQLRRPLLKLFQSKGWWIAKPPLPNEPLTGAGIRAPTAIVPTVRVLVLMRGVPFQVRRTAQNPKQAEEDEASVDSELTALGLSSPPVKGGMRNPYFNQAARFPHASNTAGLLLVGRLDGPDDATVRRMIDDALAAEKDGLLGRAVIDLAQKTGPYAQGEDWLKHSADTYKQAGIPVYIDREAGLIPDHWPLPDTILYFGWYTDHITGALASPSFRFKRGAIACHLHSFSASIIRTTDKAWVGPLLAKGAAVTFGNVYEPYLSLTIHFDLFNKRLLEGFTIGEASWNATPALSWMNVVLGDPLYRPFGKGMGAVMGEGAERDYTLYQGMIRRMAAESDAQVKTALANYAEKRKRPRLLELTALLSELQAKHTEAADLFEHAGVGSETAAERLRLRLYRAEMLRRAGKPGPARDLLRQTLADDRFRDLAARAAVEALLTALGG